MSGESQPRSWRENNQHHSNNDHKKEQLLNLSTTVPKPKTRRGGVKVRARAARKAQRLVLEEEQRKANLRHQTNEEAAENVVHFEGMQVAPQVQKSVRGETGPQATADTENVTRLAKTQAAAREYDNQMLVQESIKSSVRMTCHGKCEDLVFEDALKTEDKAYGPLDLDVGDGGFAECLCAFICVCDTAQCKCADGCVCD